MQGLHTPHDVLSVLGGIVIAAIFLVIAFRCLRSGKSGPQIDFPEISANRLTNPKLYWLFQSIYVACATMGLSLSLIFFRSGILAAISFGFFFGAGFAMMAIAMGLYSVYGFRTGKALMVYQGVTIYDRRQSPRWFWATQIQNVVATGFFGVIGIGTIVFVIWVGYSS